MSVLNFPYSTPTSTECAEFLYRLVGLVVEASASRAEDLGFKPHWSQDFFESSHTSDLNIGTPVATLPGAWHYRVSAGTGRHGVSILWLGEVDSLVCSFCCWDIKQPTTTNPISY